LIATVAPTHFADRISEVQEINELFVQAQARASLPYNILNIFGVMGIGKTTLLSKLRDQMRRNGAPCAYIDFARRGYEFSQGGHISLLEEIANQCGTGLGGIHGTSQLEKALQRYWGTRRRSGLEALADVESTVALELSKYLFRLLEHRPILLLFDTSEELDTNTFNWFQEYIIEGVLRNNGNLLLVVAGRQPATWKWRIRNRVKPYRMSPFKLDGIREQIPGYANLAHLIWGITFGHPLSNLIVMQRLAEWELRTGKQPNQSSVEILLPVLSKDLNERFVNQQLLAGAADDVRAAIRVVSLVRRFDLTSLEVLLKSYRGMFLDGANAGFIMALIRRMRETGLVEWDKARKGYKLDETVRRQIEQDIRHSDNNWYFGVHETVSDLYRQLLEHPLDNRVINLLELLYHQGRFFQKGKLEEATIVKGLSNLLLQYLNQFCRLEAGVDLVPAIELLEELRLDAELHDICGPGYQHLMGAVENFIHQNAGTNEPLF
jgi:hypothetical protein